ncbi:hypothetical protein G9A89_022034 [Geosiphon pyriformis]|nr:hypothetical protein G9A89_022034 [Geosiphon pyriformis]
MEVAFEHQVRGLLFNSTAEIITCIILQRTNTDNTKPKVAESENIGANHLEFAKSLFQYYCQYLGLNHNHISTKSAFNFYVNEKISSLLETPVNTESARENFYRELIQNTNLSTNHNFISIITEINKEIEHHTQQRYPITYASKGKEKLQTPAKNRIESPSNSSYHYIPESAINILSTDMFSSTATSAFRQFLFQTESEKEEEESKNQEFTYQHPITKNLENNSNPELINQQNLPLPLQLPPQQSVQQQLLQQPPQPPNLDPMAYAPIAKLDNFTGKEDDAQEWLNDVEKAITANGWNDAQAMQAISYFLKDTANSCNNNSINCLVNTFTTMKQEKTEMQLMPTISQPHRYSTNLSMAYTLQDAVTCTRDFESTKSEANHAQAINLVINGSSELDSKLEKFSESINKRLKEYLTDNHTIYQPLQRRNNQGNSNRAQNQPRPSSSTNQQWQQETRICHYCGKQEHIQIDLPKLKPTRLPTSDAVISLSISGVSSFNLLTTATSNLSTTAATNNLSTPTNSNTTPKLTTQQNPKTENDLTELEIGNDALTNNLAFVQKQPLTSNISPITITEDEFLAAIFPFKFEETITMLLFSGAALEAKPITTMYTDAKVEGQSIKLILNSSSTGSIIT